MSALIGLAIVSAVTFGVGFWCGWILAEKAANEKARHGN